MCICCYFSVSFCKFSLVHEGYTLQVNETISQVQMSKFNFEGFKFKSLIWTVAIFRGGRTRRAPPPTVQNFLDFMHLFRKIWQKSICWRPPRGLAPPPTGNPGSAPAECFDICRDKLNVISVYRNPYMTIKYSETNYPVIFILTKVDYWILYSGLSTLL